MKKIKDNRSVVEEFLLGVCTCGIYYIWYQDRMVCDINEMLADDGKKTENFPMRLVWTLLTCTLYDFVWRYRLAARLNDALKKRNAPYSLSGVGQTVLGLLGRENPLFFFIADHKLIKATNQLAKIHNKSQYEGEDDLEDQPFDLEQ